MKTKTIALLTIIGLSFNAHASDTPYFTADNPTLIIKAGAGSINGKLRGALIIEAETGLCNGYKHCYNPFVTIINNTPGIGVDYVYKPIKRGNDALKLSAGFVKFDKPFENKNTTVAHLGAGFEMYTSDSFGLIVSADAFDINNPLLVVTFGIHLR